MKQLIDSRFLSLAIMAAAVTFSGCSTTGSVRQNEAAKAAAAKSANVIASKTVDAESATATAPNEALPESEVDASLLPDPAGNSTLPGPEQYENLFDRITAGFQLEDLEDPSIDQQLAWYVEHPQYLERTFTRGERYLYFIVTELEARNMPLELALLPVVESAFEPFGYSRARASGLWQFISGTGKRFGLKQNWWYDGRRDIVQSTRAALDYLQFLHDEFGDWLLAVAAYNCGEMNVLRAIKRNLAANKPTDFWHLKLPRETRAYVPKLMAMSRLVRDPAAQGVELVDIPNEPFFGIVSTGGQIDLHTAADLAGITQEELINLNPAYNRWATDPEGPHELILPIDVCEIFTENLTELPASERVRVSYYEVRTGDTLSSIARQHGTTAQTLMQLNNLSSTKLALGQSLTLTGGGSLHPKVALAAQRYDRPGRALGGSKRYHVVRSGETLWSIARRYGLKVHTLASLNGLRPNSVLPVGRKLVVRGG